ncbi:hypothetical protein [Paenibacillus sp. MMS20-IR301]|uniref:SGNH/GDSL hydrolase family protein n=1 Tax=Paenibacillus sp. MMS20-IR301 TaxID=2895946 RepID=UPI0028EA80E2|nr:hypothetical protein [Paenibacillus sp. MMS20-IR301]WNS46097.1 hypothetical protein LOS79_12740 [Paenibacillus sp. MMS20-IR301]
MKNKGTGMIWLLVIVIIALVYLGVHREVSSEPGEKVIANQPVVQSQQPVAQNQQQVSRNTPQPLKEEQPFTGNGVTAIGDSVMVGVEPYLKELLPDATVNGKESRQMVQAQKLITELETNGKLGDYIIIELGTNGPFNKKQLRNILTTLSGAKQVLLVTARVPKGWQDTVNTTIKDVAREFNNAKVVDWYAASEGKSDYFYKDGVHLKPEGSRYYASLLLEALEK